MSKDGFTLRYLARTAAGVPRDLANTLVLSRLKPIRPTVLIYNCTWVCDAQCEMCNNWKHGDRKSDMTLAQLEPALAHPLLGRRREPEHLRRRTDDAQRPARDGRDVPPASAADAQDRDQHDRTDAAPRDSDAHADRRVLRGARPADQHPRVARRHRRRPRSGASRQERLRQGLQDDRRDAGARREAPEFPVRRRVHDLRDQSRGRAEHPRRGRERRSSTSCSTCCGSPTRC